jgi:ribosomal protein S18
MQPGNHIRYLRRQEIDIARWDACMAAAPNGLIYGHSFYLDHMTDGQWDALVLEDYSAIMPLTWRRRAGIRYLYQPAFTQQTGIFSPGSLSPALVGAFLDRLGHHFRFAEIFLNYTNSPSAPLRAHSNFILPLDASYQQLSGQYKKDLVRNLQSAARAQLNYSKEEDLRTALDGYRRQYEVRTPHVKEEDYRRFEKLCFFLQEKGQVLIRAVTGQRQEVLATALLLRDAAPAPEGSPIPDAASSVKQTFIPRLYLLQSTTMPAGRQVEANHFLLDGLVKEWAGNSLLLDFEGSDLPGIAHFYRNFGSRDQPYFFYRYNNLPWPLRLLKK